MMTDSPTPSTSRHHDDKCDKPERSDKTVLLQIQDINSQVAQFRDLLINIGQPRDCPELREKIRKLRRSCVEACKSTSQLVLPHVQSAMDVGIPVDSPNLVLLFYVAQLFLRELHKSKNLIRIIPMDMSGYYESRAGPSYIGNVVSQILLCKQIRPDFNEEELCSIRKDSEEIGQLIAELQEFMPQSEADTGTILPRNPWPYTILGTKSIGTTGHGGCIDGATETGNRPTSATVLDFYAAPRALITFNVHIIHFDSLKRNIVPIV
ncbi:regulator of G-protein signaling 7-binding protein-like isoform X1 [Pogonomyrmex barbatus]|uniref:Regulator of G-protein signaling 7-binding protein-like isoform X1 n=1 Tax=Pogonomyrmex barbatus TaxID=144034 RepID=A0A6I9XKJ1_9HYME|nr:regulator of G-protein signaling 7-binding protein-like isoform X1 [Pogonomyrmex barbatus]